MTAKRFRVNELVKYNYSEIGEYIDENHTDKPLRNDEVVELLNELHKENQSLKFQLDECQNHKLYSRRELEKENEQLKEEKEKWKNNCSLAISENSILWNEINILREQGAEPSEAFNNYLNKKRSI